MEGRIIGMLLRLVGLATFGFVTASIASLFIGEWMNEELLDARVRGEAEAIARLADEVEQLRVTVKALRPGPSSGTMESDETGHGKAA